MEAVTTAWYTKVSAFLYVSERRMPDISALLMAPISTCMGCYCHLWTPRPVYWIRRLSPPSLLYTDETWAPADHLTHPDNGFFFSGQSLTFCTVIIIIIIIIDISLCLYFSFVWHVCKVTGRYKFKSLTVMCLVFHLDSLSLACSLFEQFTLLDGKFSSSFLKCP